MRTYIPIHWEMPKNSNHLQSCGLHTGHVEQHQTQPNLLLCDCLSPRQSPGDAVTPQAEQCSSPAPALLAVPVGNKTPANTTRRCWLPHREGGFVQVRVEVDILRD